MSKCMGNLCGQKFGKRTVIGFGVPIIRKDGRKKTAFVCRCDCGNEVVVAGSNLKNGNTQSCGCTRREKIGAFNRSHGKSHTRLYAIWCRMKQRCTNPKTNEYGFYGGRGIKVCDEWANSFDAFESWALNAGYDDSLTIDRIDTDLSYTPENCRWVSRKEQSNNKRDNHKLTFDGKTQTISMWAEETGIDRRAITQRLKRGWSVEDALTRPIRQHK